MLPFGVSSWFGYDLPLEKRLELIAQAGFTATCLWFGDDEEMVRGGRTDLIPQMVRKCGLKLDNIHLPYKNSGYIWSNSKHELNIVRQEAENGLLFCSKHHVPIMVMHPVYGETPPPPNEYGLDFFRNLVKMAENRNVIIALENIFFGGNEHLEYLFSQIPSSNLGFCYDSSHDVIAAKYRGEALQTWGKRLVTTHLSDNLGKTDDHFILGKGNINWPEVMKRFPKSYAGTLSLEIDNPEAAKGLLPDEFLKTAYTQLKKLAEMLGK